MRIIYLVQYYSPEKASGLDLVEDLIEGFAKKGWNVDLYTPTPTRGVTKIQRKEYAKKRKEIKYNNRVIIHRMHLYREGNSFFSRAFRYLLFSLECFWKVLTVPADLVFTGSGPPTQGVVVGFAKKIARKKRFVYNLQDIFPDSLVTSGFCKKNSILMIIGHKMEMFSYHSADVVITISEDMKDNVNNKGIDDKKIKVVRNWINVDTITHLDKQANALFSELSLDSYKFYVIYAGNLGKVQGIDVILEAATLLQENNKIHFLIFGNGSEEDRIKKESQKLHNLSLFPLQPINRVSEVYSLGDVAIIPCKKGTGISGMPSKTWTIMATSTPIIASFDLGSEMERTIKEANCGYCVPAGDAKMLAEKILYLSCNAEIGKIMGKNARGFVEKNNSRDQAVQKYIDIIEDALL